MLNHSSGNLGDFGKKKKKEIHISLDKEEAWN